MRFSLKITSALKCVLVVLAVVIAEPLGSRFASGAASTAASLQTDIVYGEADGEPLKLDLALPAMAADAKPEPAIVGIHGGGWQAGDKTDLRPMIQMLASQGYVAVSINYRLAPRHPWPAQLEDSKCAVRFLRAHAADYHLDPEHIGAIGFSAGAHLAMMLGLTRPEDHMEGTGGNPDQPTAVQVVISFSGPTDLNATDFSPAAHEILRTFLVGDDKAKAHTIQQASPVNYLPAAPSATQPTATSEGAKRTVPPMLLFQGSKDELVPPTQAYRMADALTRAGVAGRVEILLGEGHGFGADEIHRAIIESLAFAGKYLKK